MKLSGRYKLLIRGDTDALATVSSTTFKQIGYLSERLFTGQAVAEKEFEFFGIRVDLVDGEVEIPIIPQDQFAAVLDAETEATPEQIEAGWNALPAELVDELPVETMQALYAAMVKAR